MKATLSGPMFEPVKTQFWESTHGKSGAHYNTFYLNGDVGMEALRAYFPDGKCNEYNFVLFSTSGVHGTYTTIEDIEKAILHPDLEREGWIPELTFLIIQPRIVCMRYGTAKVGASDIPYLKKLRKSSASVVSKIGF